MRRFVVPALAAVLAFSTVAATPADAGRRKTRDATNDSGATETSPPRMFYPQEVEGGSTGNLPFNNQIRKHTDPLNANGAR